MNLNAPINAANQACPPGQSPEQSPGQSSEETQVASELAALISRVRTGEPAAWNQLVHLYARRIYALAYSRLRNHHIAQDLTQSVFATLASKLSALATDQGYVESGKFEPWLFRIVINRVRDHVRKVSTNSAFTNSQDAVDLSAASAHSSLTSPSLSSQDIDQLNNAISMLSEPEQLVIHLRHHAGLSFAQISQLEGEPIGTLLARHHRALGKLKQLLSAPTSMRDLK